MIMRRSTGRACRHDSGAPSLLLVSWISASGSSAEEGRVACSALSCGDTPRTARAQVSDAIDDDRIDIACAYEVWSTASVVRILCAFAAPSAKDDTRVSS